MRRRGIRSKLAILLAAGAFGTAPSPAVGAPCVGPSCGLPIDHYKCYQTRITANTPKFVSRTVTLMDQFETIDSLVKKPATLCNPVSKNGEPIMDTSAHLTCYATKDMRTTRFAKQDVIVTNQFGEQRLTVQKPYQLCVPTRKGIAPAPPAPSTLAIDHYRCYKAKPAKGSLLIDGVPVTLADQFETRAAVVKKCLRFCAPVSKNGEIVLNPAGHLTCYKLVRDPGDTVPPFPRIDLNVTNQFGDLQVTARALPHLCVPSLKELGSPGGAFFD